MSTIYPKQLVGIYLDHHEARIIDARSLAEKSIGNRFENRVRDKGQSPTGNQLGNHRHTNNEATEHHQERHDTIAYFKEIAKSIVQFNEIYLFGPTLAKEEFQNFLLSDNHFRDKIIRVESTDYLTPRQQIAQVKRYFSFALN